MKSILFQDKYPITTMELPKNETTLKTVQDIAQYYQSCIENTDKVSYIGTFDHMAHTQAIGGDIAPNIQAAVNVVFCFGHAIPNAQVLAVRPRSIGIVDTGEQFVISFMDAPMKPANDAMQAWTQALVKA